jgi:hypothetical protein
MEKVTYSKEELIEELDGLNERIEKLNKFLTQNPKGIAGDREKKLGNKLESMIENVSMEHDRFMKRQLCTMIEYANLLKERIGNKDRKRNKSCMA